MKIQKLIQSRFAKLRVLIALLLLAGVGSYLVFSSQAEQGAFSEMQGRIRWMDNGSPKHFYSNYVVPLGGNADGEIDISFTRSKHIPESPPQNSVYVLFAYNPEMIRFLGSTCEWKYGCTIKVGDDIYFSAEYTDEVYKLKFLESPRNIWKAQVLMCFNMPANPSDTPYTRAGTYRFKRTNVPMPEYRNAVSGALREDTVDQHRAIFSGEKQGSCEANPDFKGIMFTPSGGICGQPGGKDEPKCNGLSDPGIGGATLTGFGNGGNGNGGEGSGNNGVGSGPGAGSGGGGGGSSANKQANKPNSLPSPSAQGENKQTELEPDPFFDGKDFEKGSDSDNLVFGNSTIGGKKVPKLVLYILSAVLLGGAGGALYWRWKRQKI